MRWLQRLTFCDMVAVRMRKLWSPLLLVLLVLAASAHPAVGRADDQTPRAVPDYDGRGPEPTTAGDVALWVPRILLSPLYVVSEYVLRRPLGWLVTAAEREQLPALLVDFFTFGPDRKAGIVPTALFDFGFRPSVGLYAFGDDFLLDDNDLRLYAATGGTDWLSFAATNRMATSDSSSVSLQLSAERRPDWVFFGLGFDSDRDDQSRYAALRFGAEARYEARPWRASRVSLSAGVQSVRFQDDTCCDDPTLRARAAQGRFALPPGYEDGYLAYQNRAEVVVDTRRERPHAGTGLRLVLDGGLGFDLRRGDHTKWATYGGTLGLYWDPTGHNRVVGLTLSAQFAESLSGPIPFTEQVTLGGTELMRGFLKGRLVGRSALVGTLEYRWPVWISLDGTLHAAVGNVFGPQLDGVSLGRMRLSAGIGFRTTGSRDHSFDVLLGFGSEPFDRFRISSLRFLVGATRGF